MTFLNLTTDSGNGIIINLKHVLKIRKRSTSKGSLIVLRGNDVNNVKETLAEISTLIKNKTL